ncbi:MAG: hypothetical protein AB1625_14175 [Acidobacteriota bacterium]
MGRARRITANLPENLLDDALRVTGKGITETPVTGLRRVPDARPRKGHGPARKGHLVVDMDESRERARR